jgi:hypothetical protein
MKGGLRLAADNSIIRKFECAHLSEALRDPCLMNLPIALTIR